MTCIEAKNGKEAVDLVLEASQNNRPFKVIIMDCQMPEMDGWEASRCIKSLHASLLIDKMPDIIGYTTFTSKEDIQKCFDSGMSHYISKPAACSVIMQQIIKSLNSNNLKLA